MADTESEGTTGPRKGLWALMGQQKSNEEAPVPHAVVSDQQEKTADEVESEVPASPSKPGDKPKGLWSLMQQADKSDVLDSDSARSSEQLSESEGPLGLEMRGAFEAPVKGIDRRLSQRQPVPATPVAIEQPVDDSQFTEPPEDAAHPTAMPVPTRVATPVPTRVPIPIAVASDFQSIPSLIIPPPVSTVNLGLSRSAIWCAILGAISLPISITAIWPAVWTRIPPFVCGFIALICGFLAISEIKRSKGRTKGRNLAILGVALGLVGMFAGPLIYTPLNVYGNLCDWHSTGHLKQIGMATEAYYQGHHNYPSGGLYRNPKEGDAEPLHGWMTQLLPHLPEGAHLSEQIDLEKPYHDPSNATAMSEVVPSFLASGGDMTLIQGKYGPAHFAGLGGRITLPDGSTAHAGVYDFNSDTTRDDIVDGLSNTMIVGEISHEYPAWGEPRNWRQIGRGLNRDPQGFGNARHNGALFLMADGSVKFFGNQTDPKVLQALSTRDGEEEGF